MTRAKLDSLLHLLRTSEGRGLGSVDTVARRLQLDPMIVRRVAEQQGVVISEDGRDDEPVPDDVDPNQSTQVMSTRELLDELS